VHYKEDIFFECSIRRVFFFFFFFKSVLTFAGVEEGRGFSTFLSIASPLRSIDSSAGIVYEIILNFSVQKHIMV
jgi:hypothetical protein